MYYTLWKKTLACAVAMSLAATDLSMPTGPSSSAFAAASEPMQRGGQGRGGGGQRGGGGGGQRGGGVQADQRGGGSGQRGGGGGAPRSAPGPQRSQAPSRGPGMHGNARATRPSGISPGNRGAIHVPPSGGIRRPNGNVAQRPGALRTPSPTRPRMQVPGNLNGVARRPPVRGPINNTAGNNRRENPLSGSNNIRRDVDRTVRNTTNGLRNPKVGDPGRALRDNAVRSVTGNRQGDRNNINNTLNRVTNNNRNVNSVTQNNRQYNGNQLNYNNRQVNLGSQNYRPSNYRHNRYHGNWGGNNLGYGYSQYGRGYNGFGRGSGLNWGIGIGSGYAGFGNYGYGNSGYGRGRYGYRPFGWGLGGWGLGSLLYNSGYLGYSNPYYVGGGTTVYNYSQPIPVYYTTSAETVTTTATADAGSAEQILNNAIVEFQQNNYDAALDITNNGISEYPDDAVLHEFRSLVLFARKDYQQSAATIHSVLAVGPGWDWTTLASLYSNVALYTAQLRDLEAYTRSNPQDAAAHLLLGYHYMTCNHSDAAALQFQQVVALKPDDRVASDLYKMLTPPSEDTSAEASQPPNPTGPQNDQTSVPKVEQAQVVGQWKAARDDGSSFNLTLTNDSKFTWGFSAANKPAEEFSGTYTLEGNVLALERGEGGALIAEVAPEADGRLKFRLLGAPENDPGLIFTH